jgi:hypothetical protein
MTTKLRQLLNAPGIVLGGGAHDGLSAHIVEQVGYPLRRERPLHRGLDPGDRRRR